MKSKDQILLENLYLKILNEDFNSRQNSEFNSDYSDLRLDREFENVKKHFDQILEKISYVGEPSLDYKEDPKTGNILIMVDSFELAYDININLDEPVENQIQSIKERFEEFFRKNNIQNIFSVSAHHSTDSKDEKNNTEWGGWIGLIITVNEINDLEEENFYKICKMILVVDDIAKKMQTVPTVQKINIK